MGGVSEPDLDGSWQGLGGSLRGIRRVGRCDGASTVQVQATPHADARVDEWVSRRVSGPDLDGSWLGLADSLRGGRRVERRDRESMLQLQTAADADDWMGLGATQLGLGDSLYGTWPLMLKSGWVWPRCD